MKKIMIALAAVAMAISAQAATYNWKSIKGAVTTDGTNPTTATLAYLFDANAYSQDTLVAAIVSGADWTANKIDSATLASGKVNTTPNFTYSGEAAESAWDAYFVVVDGDNTFISSVASVVTPSDESATGIVFNSQKNNYSAFDAANGFQGAGWYSTAAVPEPTSALMLLVGLAGLALKRKVA